MQKILSESVLNNPESSLCHSCWTNLETFHEFCQFVAANYDSNVLEASFDSNEEKFIIQEYHSGEIQEDHSGEICEDDIKVYDEDAAREELGHEEIKLELVYESTEAEWLDENVEETEDRKKQKKIPSLNIAGTVKTTAIPIDSADDQRIRETAKMICDICPESLDSLRDAKSHYKNAHGVDGYIICCQR